MKWNAVHLLSLTALALASCQYHYVPDRKTWSEAQIYCREKYTDLATITNSSDMQRLNELSSNHSINGSIWIGLYNNVHNWSSEIEKLFHSYIDHDCVFICHGSSHVHPCDTPASVVCRDEDCSAPHGFIYFKGPYNWTEAQRLCQQNHGHLATVRNLEERDYLQNISLWSTLQRIHVDFYGDSWTWSDGSEPSFINWLDSKLKYLNSSKRCAASLQIPGSQGGWETQSCTERLPFFCYGSGIRRQIVRVEFQVNSSFDLTNTLIQEVILEQIQLKLMEAGLPAKDKLSWRKQPDGQVFHKKNEI